MNVAAIIAPHNAGRAGLKETRSATRWRAVRPAPLFEKSTRVLGAGAVYPHDYSTVGGRGITARLNDGLCQDLALVPIGGAALSPR